MDIWKRKRYNMHYHIIRKRVKKKPLAWALFVLKMMFKGLKKFMQFSLKPKNPNLSSNTQKGNQKIWAIWEPKTYTSQSVEKRCWIMRFNLYL